MSLVGKRERSLAGLLVEGSVSKNSKDNWNEFFRIRYRLLQLKEKRPEVYAFLLAKYVDVLDEIRQVVDGVEVG
jgi:hypothetical protein